MLIQYATEQGWEIYGIYSDDDYTGADRSRPEFNHLLEDAKHKNLTLCSVKHNRVLQRELELVEKYIQEIFSILGHPFCQPGEQPGAGKKRRKKVQTRSTGGSREGFMKNMSENIKSVLTDKRKNGYHIGAFALYGYQKDPQQKGHLLIDEEAAEVVREVFTLFSQGYGKTAIAKILNERGGAKPNRIQKTKRTSLSTAGKPKQYTLAILYDQCHAPQ